MIKNLAIAAAFLFAATIANTEDGVKFGARYGYSLQMLGRGDYYETPGMGMLGISGGFVANIPAGPVVIAPEVAFIYRKVSDNDDSYGGRASLKEMAISVPVMVKFFPMEGLFLQSGVQFDIPIGAKWCGDNADSSVDYEDDYRFFNDYDYCFFLGDEREGSSPRASVDIGIPVGFGYMVTPRVGIDFRYVLGLTPYESKDYKRSHGTLSTIGLGLNCFF
jgi:hypothetical protein